MKTKRSTLIVAALLILGTLAVLSVPTWTIPAIGRKFAELFQRAEYMHGVPPLLLARMAQQESDYNPDARSSAGALGIMQIVPKWHPGVNPWNPAEAIDYAGSLMRKHFERFGSWQRALAAYNAGPTRLQDEVQEHGVNWLAHMPGETQSYIAKITSDVRVI